MKQLLSLLLIFTIVSSAAFATEVAPSGSETSVDEPVDEVQVLAGTARNALVYDVISGQILFEKDIHARVPIASITKVMTTLLVLEHGGLDDEITAAESAYFDLASDGSTQGIVAGETMTVRDLLYCVMVASANEACNILAEHVSGSVQAFVAEMNTRAAALGCNDTNFVNTHGLHDDDHYSSAYDVMLITREAMTHSEFMEFANTTAKTIPATNKKDTARSFFTTNHLISKSVQSGYMYHLAQGVKTGHTSKAGYCLVSSASQNNISIITVVLGAEKVDDKFMSFVETKELMEWVFDSFAYREILSRLEIIDKVKVNLGKDYSEVTVTPLKSLSALIPKDLEVSEIERLITLPDGIDAPIAKGQELGEITLAYNGHEYGTIPLTAVIAVERSQEESLIQDVEEFVENPWLKYVIIGAVSIIILYAVIVIVYNSRRRRSSNTRSNYKGKKRRRRW